MGSLAALSKIVAGGYFDPKGEEQLPLLSFENIWIAKIIGFTQSISYQEIPQDCFKNTIGKAHSPEELQELMLTRYQKTLPTFTDNQILAQGVSIRDLQLTHVTTLPQNWL